VVDDLVDEHHGAHLVTERIDDCRHVQRDTAARSLRA
jgi:hypothetical protein